MKTHTGTLQENKSEISDLLNMLLADQTVLYVKKLNCHWRITGSNFYAIHTLLDSQSKDLAKLINRVAHRIREIGGYPLGTMKDYLKRTRLKEIESEKNLDQDEMLKVLINDHEKIIRISRNDIIKMENFMDVVTADFVTSIVEAHEKMVWKLKASFWAFHSK